MRQGWQAASAELVALVDSDVVWAPGVADAVRAPFADRRVGGVATAQHALDPDSICELTLRAGYRTVFQRTATVWSRYPDTAREFLGQRLRNARNFWRVRLTALVTGWVWRHPYLALGTLADVIRRGGFWLCEIYLVVLALKGQALVPAAVAAWYVLHQAHLARQFVRQRALPRWHIPAQVTIDFLLKNLDLVGLLTMRRQTWLTRRTPQGPNGAMSDRAARISP